MISICIPIFNFNVSPLVEQLSAQLSTIENAEIVLIDDGSDAAFISQNQDACSAHNYVVLPENIGRSAIRNLFLTHAKYDHLLFLDCDSLIENSAFIANYVAGIKGHPQSVLCGGRIYPTIPPSRDFYLRWKYGVKRESKPATERSKAAYRAFMTNNFVVSKNVFTAIKFDERLKNYGHEDTLFGFELKENSVPIVHLENPIMNGHLETNQVYVANTERAVENLVHILEFTAYNKEIINDVTLLRSYYKLKAFRPLILLTFNLFGKSIKKRLLLGKVNLFCFNFYKLGYLVKTIKFK